MTLTLTDEQRRQVAANPGTPVLVVDPQTNQAYVLVPAEVFEQLSATGDYHLRETYGAQFRAAFAAGWGEPAMDDYDRYDEVFAKSCRSSEGTLIDACLKGPLDIR